MFQLQSPLFIDPCLGLVYRTPPPPLSSPYFLDHLVPAPFVQQQLVGELSLTSHLELSPGHQVMSFDHPFSCSVLWKWEDAPHPGILPGHNWQAHSFQFNLVRNFLFAFGGHSARIWCLFLTVQKSCDRSLDFSSDHCDNPSFLETSLLATQDPAH